MGEVMRGGAAVIGDQVGDSLKQTLQQGLAAAGFSPIVILGSLPAIEPSEMAGAVERHLPESLRDAELIVLDETVAGRPSFELYASIRGTAEGRAAGICQLLSHPVPATLADAWDAGCDMCFTRETLDAGDLERCARLWLQQRAEPQA